MMDMLLTNSPDLHGNKHTTAGIPNYHFVRKFHAKHDVDMYGKEIRKMFNNRPFQSRIILLQ